MHDTMNAAALRQLAKECASKASAEDCLPQERERLLSMQESLLVLAKDADWLAGTCSPIANAQDLKSV